MPPPTPLPATRHRARTGRVFSRRSNAAMARLEHGLEAIMATGQAINAARAAAQNPLALASPSSGAGDEKFAASPATLSPAASLAPLWPQTPSRPATPAPTTAGTPTPSQWRLPLPRFPAAQPAIPVGRFPSPPKEVTPVSMSTLSPAAPMDTTPTDATTSYATAAASTKRAAATATTALAANATTTVPTAATTTTPQPKPLTRYPPLIVEALPDWPFHFKELKRLLGHTPNGRPFGKGVRFIPKSDQEFRAIQRYLTQLESASGISWFCYSLPTERSLKVAIRGLPANTEPAEVEQELRELGYVPEYVRRIPARPGRPGCLMFAQLQRTADLTPGIYEVRELLCMPGVNIEAWRGRRGPAQCHRCQGFRHSSHNCHRVIACVRCGGHHQAKNCERSREDPPTCANCSGAHTANSATCPAFLKETRNRKAGTVARTAPSARATSAAAREETDAPGSLMAAANQPKQQPPRRRRRKRAPREKVRQHAPEPAAAQPTTSQPAAQQPAAPQPAASQPTTLPTTAHSGEKPEPAVVAAPKRGTKAKRAAQQQASQPASQPERRTLDPRITAIVGTLNRVLQAIQDQRDPIPLILGCIAELCGLYG